MSGVELALSRRARKALLGWQRRVRDRYFGPYRYLLAAACRLLYARGQIDTAAIVHLDDVGLGGEDRQEYAPSGWRFVQRALEGIEITSQDVFVDFGSGMGRAAYVAARNYPFGRVVGVELSEEFNEIAKENIRRTRTTLRCRDVEFVTCDATEFVVPDDMTVAYFFNPFTGVIFERVVDNILASLERRERALTICYANPTQEHTLLASGRFVKVRESTGVRRDIPIYRIAVYQTR